MKKEKDLEKEAVECGREMLQRNMDGKQTMGQKQMDILAPV